jgi:DNA-binding CsgD family transcriptional regulator
MQTLLIPVAAAEPDPESSETRQTQTQLPAIFTAALVPHAGPHDTTADRNLSHREGEVLAWLAEGKSDWEIGNILVISEKTVNFHVENAKRKLCCGNRIQAAVRAVRLGLIVLLASLAPLGALTIEIATSPWP